MTDLVLKPRTVVLRMKQPEERTLQSNARRVYLRMSSRTVTNIIGQNYVHDQQVASNHWIINHNLNTYPSVTVIDSGGNVNLAQFTYVSSSRLDIFFSALTSGYAYLN